MRSSQFSRRQSPNQNRVPLTYEVDAHHRPRVGGVDILDLVKTYGTPLYVLDAATIRAMASVYRDTLRQEYPGESLVLYASKANLSMGLCKLVEQEEMGIDVVSGGELYTAIQAGFPMERVLFNGNNKTSDELEMAVHHRVGRISVDNFHELDMLHQIAAKKRHKVKILLRLAPGIECHTHDYIKTGQTDTKFGFDMSMLPKALDFIVKNCPDTLELVGLHAHIGSQIFEVQPYEDLAQMLLNIFYNVRQSYDGLTMTELNLGGGMGIQYTREDDPPQVQLAVSRIVYRVRQYADQLKLPLPKVYMEPGRSMVATAGLTLYKVGSTKAIPRVRKYVAVDGGMGDNIRPALYQAKYSALVANKLHQQSEETVTVVGKYCESGDVLIPQINVPRLESGDVLMVFGTGAYNYSMASNYNRIPRPATVLVENGTAHLLVKRETYEAVIQHDLIPDYLMAQKQPPEKPSEKAAAPAETKPAKQPENPQSEKSESQASQAKPTQDEATSTPPAESTVQPEADGKATSEKPAAAVIPMDIDNPPEDEALLAGLETI